MELQEVTEIAEITIKDSIFYLGMKILCDRKKTLSQTKKQVKKFFFINPKQIHIIKRTSFAPNFQRSCQVTISFLPYSTVCRGKHYGERDF